MDFALSQKVMVLKVNFLSNNETSTPASTVALSSELGSSNQGEYNW
jgi:hypothetical protein